VNPTAAVEGLGERFDLVDPGNVYKQYPTCSLTHCAIDMVLDGVASGAIEPQRVLRVECGVGTAARTRSSFTAPATARKESSAWSTASRRRLSSVG